MIRGAHSINLDSKGRLAVPAKFRDGIIARCEGHMIVTVNDTKEHCLWLYPLDEWERVEKDVVGLSTFPRQHQKLKRFLLGYACDVEMDGSGRILLPAPLREFAMMTKAILLIGQGNKFEIWSEDLWNVRMEQWLQEDGGADSITAEMEKLSL